MKSPRYAAALTAALALSACANLPDDGNTSAVVEPIINGTAAAEYPEAAVLNMPLTATTGAACSGTLVAPRVILTAGHCVDGFSRWEVYVGTTLRTSTTGVTYDWAEHGATTVNPNHHDLGLVFLDAPVVIARYPAIAAAPVAAGSTVVNVGRIHNGAITSTAWQAPVAVRDGASVGYPYDYAASAVIEHGDSGGPGFALGSHTLVAVNSGAGGSLEVLARVDLLRDWIAAQISAHGGMSTATADAGAPAPADAGARTAGGAPDAGARTDAGSTACVAASGRNTTLAAAEALAGCASGSFTTALSAEYFVFTPVSGTPYTLRLVRSGDATFTVGVVTAGATGSTCAPLATGQTAVQFTLTGSVRPVCLVVASAARAAQTWSLTRTW